MTASGCCRLPIDSFRRLCCPCQLMLRPVAKGSRGQWSKDYDIGKQQLSTLPHPPAPGGPPLPRAQAPMLDRMMTSKTPVKKYDMNVVQGIRRGQFWASLFMCYTHLRKGMIKPMMLQVHTAMSGEFGTITSKFVTWKTLDSMHDSLEARPIESLDSIHDGLEIPCMESFVID